MRLPSVAVLVLAAGCLWGARGARQAVHRRRGGSSPHGKGDAVCQKLCRKHVTVSWEQRKCLVECRVRTDLHHEQGEDDDHCKPLANVEEIEFKDTDLNDDGVVVPSELQTVGSLLCIPDDMLITLFSDLDPNSDGRITREEWKKAGEDTVYEYEVDKMADGHTANKGLTPSLEDMAGRAIKELLAEVRAPDFEVLDTDGDGFLNEWEVLSGLMRELIQRDPTMSRVMRRHMLEVFSRGLKRAILMLDTDGDGLICPSEYGALKVGQDMGDEVKEVAERMFRSLQDDDGVAAASAAQEQLLQRLFVRAAGHRRSSLPAAQRPPLRRHRRHRRAQRAARAARV